MISERKVVCSAPGRAGIIGNPTDMYGGAVLSCSVAMRARVTITPAVRLVLATHGQECTVGAGTICALGATNLTWRARCWTIFACPTWPVVAF